jgi:hypothetical protein
MLLGIEMPLVGSPTICVKLRDAKRCQQLLKLQEDVVLALSEHIRQDLPRVMMLGSDKAQSTQARFLIAPV